MNLEAFPVVLICWVQLLLLAAAPVLAEPPPCPVPGADGPIAVAPAGQLIAKTLESMDVEHRWLRGRWLEGWRSGEPLREYEGKETQPFPKDETHCSAFAAAVADRFGIYLLRPPEHSHVLLANAQFEWLKGEEGQKAGWKSVPGPVEAQQAANAGNLVLASYRNPENKLPGHIAIVRPCEKAPSQIVLKGPEITQAGYTNYESTDLATGFSHHPGAWGSDGKRGVQFFEHTVETEALTEKVTPSAEGRQ